MAKTQKITGLKTKTFPAADNNSTDSGHSSPKARSETGNKHLNKPLPNKLRRTERRKNDVSVDPKYVPPGFFIRARRKAQRRRQIDPTTCERDYSPDELEFMNAIDQFKRQTGRPFPMYGDVLNIICKLGYRMRKKVCSEDSDPQNQSGGTDPRSVPSNSTDSGRSC